MKNKCASCDGSGIAHNWISEMRPAKDKTCYSCHGSGFDINCRDEIVCPYCGENNDSYEFSGSGKTDCEHCKKKFHVEVNHSVDYSSSRIPCLNDESLHTWKHEAWYLNGAARDGKYYYRCRKCDERKWLEQVPEELSK